MAKVYVIAENKLDFRPAEGFGQVEFLTVDRQDDFNNVNDGGNNRRLMAHLRQHLRDFDEERDWIVITGSPYVTAAVFWILGSRGVKVLRFLRWDNRDLLYIPLTLKLEAARD